MSGVRAGPREWIGLAVLALPTMLLSLDVTVLYLALPQLGADLRPDGAETLWITDVYGFMIAGFLVTMGTLGDRIGRRRLLVIGAAAFGAASVLAAYATSPQMLIVARALLGVAGSTLMPSTLSLISTMFTDPRERGSAIGIWASCFSVGIAAGPVVGGLLLDAFWWGSVFLLGVPVMAVLLVAAPLLLPEYRNPEAGRLDVVSVVLSLAAILPVIYGIKRWAGHGFETSAAVALVVGPVFGYVFARRQRRLAHPLLDLRLFRNRTFRAAAVVSVLAASGLGGMYLFVTQYLQLVEGLSPVRAGMWLLPAAFALIAATLATTVVARRVRPGYVLGGGLAVAAVGYLLLALVDSTGGLPLLVTGFVVLYAGFSPVMVLGVDLIVGSVPAEEAGSAAAVAETGTEFGLALGIAVLGSLGAAVYRDRTDESMPEGVPDRVADAAHDSLAGVTAAAEGLPAGPRDDVLGSARDAFTTGLNVVGGVGAALMLVLAALAVSMLRHAGPTADRDTAESSPDAGVEPDRVPVTAGIAADRDRSTIPDPPAGTPPTIA
ncbi:MFS transporter [Embleya sp. NPDC050154]|uniref:MFS transporter n=1 Tax=Embleya sp. NPDC050154 TaxID=3363988 RepID=UPI0037934DE2